MSDETSRLSPQELVAQDSQGANLTELDIDDPITLIELFRNDPDQGRRSLSDFIWNFFWQQTRLIMTEASTAPQRRRRTLVTELNRVFKRMPVFEGGPVDRQRLAAAYPKLIPPIPFPHTVAGKVAKLLLQDLRKLRVDEKDLFETLYYNREGDVEQVLKYVQDCRRLGENIIAVGSAGVGKSCLLLKCLEHPDASERGKLHPIFCDCREEGDLTPDLDNVRRSLGDKLIEYLRELASLFGPNEGLLPPQVLSISEPHERYRRAVKAVTNLHKKHVDALYPVLFIDDIDYSPIAAQEALMRMILPLLQTPNVVVIYAVRPPAARTIEDPESDSRVKMAFNRVRRHPVRPIAVRGFLATRLAYLLHKPSENEPSLINLWSRMWGYEDKLKRFLEKYVAHDEISRFPYPFSGRVEIFMQRITNGNLDEIVDIAIAVLSYCHKNQGKLEVRKDGAFELHRTDVIAALTAQDSHYKIFDLHAMKSQRRGGSQSLQNNSTIQNVLEMFCITHFADTSFYDRLCGPVGKEDEGYGHTRDEVNRAIDICLNARLIEEEVVSTGSPSLFTLKDLEDRRIGPYVLTEKGDFYIHDIMFWPSYLDLYKDRATSRSIFDVSEAGDVGRFKLERDIVEFLVGLVNVARQPGYLKVGKDAFFEFFLSNYGHAYWHRFEARREEDGDGYSTLSKEMFENLIRRRGFCSPHKENERSFFALRAHSIDRAAEEAAIPKGIDPDRFSKEEFKQFIKDQTSWGPDEE